MEAASWTVDLMEIRLEGRALRRAVKAYQATKPSDIERIIMEEVDKQYEEFTSVISRHLRAIELGTKHLGQRDAILSTLRSNLAHIYHLHGEYRLEVEQLVNLLTNGRHSHDALHSQTIQTMERLLRCFCDSDCNDQRAKFLKKLCVTSCIVLGIDDPRTRLREAYLERQLYNCTPPPSPNMQGAPSVSEWEEGAKRASLATNAWGEVVFQALEMLSNLTMRSHMRDAARKTLADSGRSAKH